MDIGNAEIKIEMDGNKIINNINTNCSTIGMRLLISELELIKTNLLKEIIERAQVTIQE